LGVGIVLVLAWVLFPGCGSDEVDNALDGLNGNSQTSGTTHAGDVAKLVIVGQGGVAVLPNGVADLPKEVAVGTPVVLAVIAYDKNNNVITGDALAEIYSGVTWKLSDESVASIVMNPAVAGAVILTTKKPGKVKITATYKGISASAELTVK